MTVSYHHKRNRADAHTRSTASGERIFTSAVAVFVLVTRIFFNFIVIDGITVFTAAGRKSECYL